MDIYADVLRFVGEHLRATEGLPISRVLSVDESARTEQLYGQWESFIEVEVGYISREDGSTQYHVQEGSLVSMLLDIRCLQDRGRVASVVERQDRS